MGINEGIGAKIVALRKAKGVTQADLGAHLNISYQAVSKWERGESSPDFATMSKIAQYFGVSLTYFEDCLTETAESEIVEKVSVQETSEEKEPQKAMLGICKDCGKVVYEGEEWQLEPAIVCKKCHERKRREQERQAAAEKRKREQEIEAKKQELAARCAKVIRRRNIGYVVGGIVTALFWGVFALFPLVVLGFKADGWLLCGLGTITSVLVFTFMTQMVWGGAVRNCAFVGGMLIGTPGVIFSLDLDGIAFLIGVKILFAVLRFVVFLFTALFMCAIAALISPFTFVPALLRMNQGIDAD